MKNLLIDLVAALPEVRKAAEFQTKKQSCILTGLAQSSKSAFFAAMDKLFGASGSLLFVTASREEARAIARELDYLYPGVPMQEFYPINLPRIRALTRNLELEAGRSAAVRYMAGEERGIVFVTAEAFCQKQLRIKSLNSGRLLLRRGERLEQMQVLEKLAALGYERTEQVETIGQFSRRGEILDVFPISSSVPVRIEWFDLEIDTLRTFDVDTQRSVEVLDELTIAPIYEEKVDEGVYDASILDYCAPGTLKIINEPTRLFDLVAKLAKEIGKDLAGELFTEEELLGQIEAAGALVVSNLAHNYLKQLPSLSVPVRRVSSYNKNTHLLTEDLKTFVASGITPVIMMSSALKARNFAASLKDYGLQGFYTMDELKPEKVNVMYGSLEQGFRFWDQSWIFLTENDIFGTVKRRRFFTKSRGAQLQYYSDIKAGDYVVHKIHGIGRYLGVENVVVDGMHRDYLLLLYAGDDKLYVPVDQVSMLHKYVGNEGTVPALSKMGGAEWRKTTAKAAKAITELAEELLRLYAQRKIVEGFACGPDTEEQARFEEDFPFEETPDQLQAIAEIKADMEKPQPMDRLLCGDVGYGKTEVAIRAAFKAVMNGKQVALLVPTTVLAQQHLLTFRQRMKPYGVEVEMLNRFRSASEQKEILRRLEDGLLDVVIGTHRLLQPDVHFHDLGLLIIDEEQRFGVAQKEKIKKWRTGIDVLALSATPIPRTLHMALVNGRDMSVIESPPEDRLPVDTYVCEYNEGMLKEAIERELRRGGQIYYIHNRVGNLDNIALRLRKMVPGINIRIAHGQMRENQLEDAMIEFYEGNCDVLLCTTIVENGLDVPLANTIIIDGAENFGLSQLYQMRGRVGRSSRLAYAYFVYRPDRVLSEVAEKRLAAIRDFTELGAGFKIAMRDLEIRGAGNLLGAQQHGHIAGIGFAAYCQLLEETIAHLKEGKTAKPEPEPVLELPVDAYIPDDYIPSPRYKMELYRRFSEMEYADSSDVMDEIIDRFGNPPQEVETLWRVAALRGLCRLMKVRGINARGSIIRITFAEHANVDPQNFEKLLRKNLDKLSFRGGKEPQLTLKAGNIRETPLEWLEENLPKIALSEKFRRK